MRESNLRPSGNVLRISTWNQNLLWMIQNLRTVWKLTGSCTFNVLFHILCTCPLQKMCCGICVRWNQGSHENGALFLTEPVWGRCNAGNLLFFMCMTSVSSRFHLMDTIMVKTNVITNRGNVVHVKMCKSITSRKVLKYTFEHFANAKHWKGILKIKLIVF